MAWKGWENFDPSKHERAVQKQGNDTPKKPSKMHNTKVNVDGEMFDSKAEAARWRELQHDERLGLISELKRQVPFDLTVMARDPTVARDRGFQKIGEYRADFTYVRDGIYVVEDKKGYRTDMYRWKKKHFEIEYNRRILET